MNFPNIRCAGRGAPGILSDDLTEAELDQIFRDRKKTIEKKSLVFFLGGGGLFGTRGSANLSWSLTGEMDVAIVFLILCCLNLRVVEGRSLGR